MLKSGFIDQSRVNQTIRERTNTLMGLTPERLTAALDQFRIGYLYSASTIFDLIEDRDPILKGIISKRKADTARREWSILTLEGADETEAGEQADVLREFYNHVTAVNILAQDETGGIEMLIRQMMDAVGRRWAAHEVVWQPRADGSLGAVFNYCPLHFFEHRTGKLRFKPTNFSLDGIDMAPERWMVTTGDGLMVATAVAQLFRSFSLRDWLGWCEKYGFPLVLGKTNAAPGSAEWSQMEDAVAAVSRDWAGVVNSGAMIEFVQAGASGTLPFNELQDVMTRYVTALWRGGDLSTLSKDNSVGASLQQESGDTLTADDCAMIERTLNKRISPLVLEQRFGPGVQPLAYFHLAPPKRQETEKDIQVDTFLVAQGVRLGKRDALERYGRKGADDGEEALGEGVEKPEAGQPLENERRDSLRETAENDFREAVETTLQGVGKELAEIAGLDNAEARYARLKTLLLNYESLSQAALSDLAAGRVLEESMAAALANGAAAKTETPL